MFQIESYIEELFDEAFSLLFSWCQNALMRLGA